MFKLRLSELYNVHYFINGGLFIQVFYAYKPSCYIVVTTSVSERIYTHPKLATIENFLKLTNDDYKLLFELIPALKEHEFNQNLMRCLNET